MGAGEWEVVVAGGAGLGEGPVWTGDRLWWVDIEHGHIHRTDLATGADEITEMGEPIGAVIPRGDGGFLTGVPDGIAFHDTAGAEEHRLIIEPDDTDARMNDAKCDPAGRLFTGTMTHDDRRSALYRLDPDGSVTTVFTGVGISNGLGWSPDHTRMYYIDTPTMTVDVCDYDEATGAVDNRRPLIEVGEGQGSPDGMTVDAEGCLWVAFWDGWCLRRFDAHGALMRTVELPVARVTSAAFGGPDLDQLLVTTASCELGADELAAQPHAGALFRVDPGCRGVPAGMFAG